MKHVSQLYRVIALVCLLSTCGWAQYGPFKGANTIILSTHLADKDAYQAITQVLAEHQIVFSEDTDALWIRSGTNSSLADQGLVFDGQLSVSPGIIKLCGRVADTAYIGSGGSNGKVVPISYAKDRSSWQRMGFSYMDELARKLQSALQGPLMYKYQKESLQETVYVRSRNL